MGEVKELEEVGQLEALVALVGREESAAGMEEVLGILGKLLSENEELLISIPEVNIIFREGAKASAFASGLEEAIGQFCLDNCCEYL